MSAQFEFDAIGTHWWCELLDTTEVPNDLPEAVDAYVRTFDQDYSRFIETSLISKLNRGEILHNPPRELYDMLVYARQLFEQSEGAFNVTVGGVLHAKGYGSRSHAARIWYEPWSHITLTPKKITLPHGMTIDLGGFGKGWLIDKLGELFQAHGHTHFVINGGGDMLIRSKIPLTIKLENPHSPTEAIGEVSIARGALAASSNAKRTWKFEGKTHHHIIDPLSANPEALGTFVTADTALTADSLATILLLRPHLKDSFETEYHASALVIKN